MKATFLMHHRFHTQKNKQQKTENQTFMKIGLIYVLKLIETDILSRHK